MQLSWAFGILNQRNTTAINIPRRLRCQARTRSLPFCQRESAKDCPYGIRMTDEPLTTAATIEWYWARQGSAEPFRMCHFLGSLAASATLTSDQPTRSICATPSEGWPLQLRSPARPACPKGLQRPECEQVYRGEFRVYERQQVL
jgi:hypothetical protein